MHLPDGILDTKTVLLSGGAAVAGVGIALRQVRHWVGARQRPLLGLASAFVFAAQMLNFPIAGGTSGHLTGGVLIAVLLGPASAVLVMTCVLIVQCLMFADGGLLALGANVFNMAIVGAGGGFLVFRGVRALSRGHEQREIVFAAMFAGWCGTVLASITCAGQLALSGAAPWSITFPAMANIHMLIGVGEGLATGLISLAVLRARPEMVYASKASGEAVGGGLVAYGLLLCAGLVVFVAPFACPWPDGLDTVAGKLGLDVSASSFPAPLTDYRLPFIGSPVAATAAAGLAGTVTAFVAAFVLARLLVPGLGHAKETAHGAR
jgi:cobalt/nickel transport system permease protein